MKISYYFIFTEITCNVRFVVEILQHSKSCCLTVTLLFVLCFALCCVLINCLTFFNLFILCLFSCFVCFAFHFVCFVLLYSFYHGYRPQWPRGVQEAKAPRFLDTRHMKVVRSSALPAAFTPRNILVLIFTG